MEEEEWKEGGDVKRVEDDEGDEFPEMKRSALEREENFLKLLIAIEGGKPSEELYSLLFDLLLSNSSITKTPARYRQLKCLPQIISSDFPHQEKSEETPTPLDFYYIFFQLLRRADIPPQDQVGLVSKVGSLVTESTRLRVYCSCDSMWTSRLLRLILSNPSKNMKRELVALVQQLGPFSVSVRETKSIFQLMRIVEKNGYYYRPQNWPLILDVLRSFAASAAAERDMASQGNWGGPSNFFDMDGLESGFSFPNLEAFPQKSYSIVCWFRIESHIPPFEPKGKGLVSYCPTLLSLATEDNYGLDMFVHNGSLVVQCRQGGTKKAQFKLGKFVFEKRKWYFVVVTHQYHFLSKDELHLIVNGQLVAEGHLSFPKITKPIKYASIGCALDGEGMGGITRQSANLSPFFGQIGKFLFCQEPITPASARTLYSQGIECLSEPNDIDEPIGHTGSHLYFGKNKQVRVFLGFDPVSVMGSDGRVVDVSGIGAVKQPSSKIRWKKVGAHATIHRGTRTVQASRFPQSLSMTGIHSIIMLFAQLNSKVEGLEEGLGGGGRDSRDDSFYLLQLFQLLQDLLLSITDCSVMERSNGFGLIAHVLRLVPPRHLWSPQIIRLLDFSEALQGAPTLYFQFYKQIMLNFDLWVRTDFGVQKEILSILLSHASKNPSLFVKMVSVQKLLDILRDYYSLGERERRERESGGERGGEREGSSVSLSLSSSVSTSAIPLFSPSKIENNINIREMKELRGFFMKILQALTKGRITPEIMKHLLMYINTADAESALDILRLLLNCFHDAPARARPPSSSSSSGYQGSANTNYTAPMPKEVAATIEQTIESICALGGVIPFVGLIIQDVSLKVRIWTLKLIGKLLCHSDAKRQLRILAQGYWSLSSLKGYLQPFLFSESIYFGVLELLLESVHSDSVLSPLEPLPEIVDPSDPLSAVRLSPKIACSPSFRHKIKHPSLLPTIFELAAMNSIAEIQEQVLIDTLHLLAFSEENRTVFLEQKNWQNWLLGILAARQSSSSSQPGSPIELETTLCYKVTLQLLNLLVFYSMFEKNGWKTALSIAACVTHFEERGFINGSKILRKLRELLLRSFISNYQMVLGRCKKDTFVWINVICWVQFVEQSLFVDSVSKKGGEDDPFFRPMVLVEGKWIDLQFSQLLLRFFDNLLELSQTLRAAHVVQPQSSSQSQRMSGNVQENSDLLSSSSSLLNENSPSLFEDSNNILFRFSIRLVLYTFWSVDGMFMSGAGGKKREDLGELQGLVKQNLEALSGTKMKESLQRFIRLKANELMKERQTMDTQFKQNIDRLRDIITRLLLSQTQHFRIFFVIYFLFHMMKRSYEGKGMGAELILPLFQNVIVRSRTIMPLEDRIKSSSEEELLTFFMKHLSMAPEAVALATHAQLGDAIKSARAKVNGEDSELAKSGTLLIRRAKLLLSQETQLEEKHELNRWRGGEEELSKFREGELRIENERIKLAKRGKIVQRARLASEWRTIVRNLTNSRGPWAISHSDSHQKWKMEKRECSMRMRRVMKRNYTFDPHSEAIKYTSTNSENTAILEAKERKSMRLKLKKEEEKGEEEREGEKENGNEEEEEPIFDDETDFILVEKKYEDSLIKNEKKVFHSTCQLIGPMVVLNGDFIVTDQHIFFFMSEDEREAIETIKRETREEENIFDQEDQTENFHSAYGGANRNRGEIYRKIKGKKDRKWRLTSVVEIQQRKYMLQDAGLEIFLKNQKNYFFYFFDSKVRGSAIKSIARMSPNLASNEGLVKFTKNFVTMFQKSFSSTTERWRKREITNFEYLMFLNTLAGRTYNDLNQYPVFPWVLSDYTSETIDLSDEKVYRDLSKPVGALNPVRLQQVVDRYEMMEDDGYTPKFHYGSHYSSVGTVLYYLVRMEPFTTHFLTLQGGKFDHESRMFHSIPDSWNGVLTNSADVKELTPEFYYCPEFLKNSNQFVFGEQRKLGDVVLPPWAKGDPKLFIRIHRQALESEYVSMNLHHWIDLIFGYKQRGQAAIDAVNVFYHLTYFGNVPPLHTIEDETERNSIESQIANFGVTPGQLFTKPHTPRISLDEFFSKVRSQGIWQRSVSMIGTGLSALTFGMAGTSSSSNSSSSDLSSFSKEEQQQLIQQQQQQQQQQLLQESGEQIEGLSLGSFEDMNPSSFLSSKSVFPVKTSLKTLFTLCEENDFLFTLSQWGLIGHHSLTLLPENKVEAGASPFVFDLDKSIGTQKERRVDLQMGLRGWFVGNVLKYFGKNKMVISGGAGSGAVQCVSLTSMRSMETREKHLGMVTSVDISSNGLLVVTGSCDTTVGVWEVDVEKVHTSRLAAPLRRRVTLTGHDDEVLCVKIDIKESLVLSCSMDCTAILSSLHGRYLRTFQHNSPVVFGLICSRNGTIITYSDDNKVYFWTYNGDRIAVCDVLGHISCMVFTTDQEYVILGSKEGHITVFNTLEGREVTRLDIWPGKPILCLKQWKERFLVVGHADGDLSVAAFDSLLWDRQKRVFLAKQQQMIQKMA